MSAKSENIPAFPLHLAFSFYIFYFLIIFAREFVALNVKQANISRTLILVPPPPPSPPTPTPPPTPPPYSRSPTTNLSLE